MSGSGRREDIEKIIDRLTPEFVSDGPSLVQVQTAKAAAKMVARALPGPNVVVSLSGHANGAGWQAKPGYASETVTITVTQVTE